jgi:hypothetical protein
MAPLGLRSENQNAITDRASILGSLVLLRNIMNYFGFLKNLLWFSKNRNWKKLIAALTNDLW